MFWTLVLVIVVFAGLDAISHGLAVAVGVVLAIVLIARGFARSAKRQAARRRP